jgi:hypothetical protein
VDEPENRLQHQSPEDEPEGSPQTVRVRQGISAQGVIYVLGFSLAAVIFAFILLAAFISYLT